MERNRMKKNRSYAPSTTDIITEILKYAAIYIICIIYWEILIYHRTQSSFAGFGLWHILFSIPIGVFLSALNGWFPNNPRLNRIITAVIALIVSIYYGADLIYYESFGSLFSVSMMGMGGDAITNFWWSLSGTILKNIPRLLLYELPVIFLFAAAFAPALESVADLLPHGSVKPLYHGAAVIGALLCWGIAVLLLPLGGKADTTAYGAYHSKFVDTDTASKKLGALTNTLVEWKSSVFGSSGGDGLDDALSLDDDQDPSSKTQSFSTQIPGDASAGDTAADATPAGSQVNAYEGLDFNALAEKTGDEKIQSICNYLAKTEPTNKNAYTGMFEGYNLIYICAESFSSYALNEKMTPNLCKMASEGIVLNNYYNGFKNTTTNGEFAMLTGVWPDVSREDAKMGSKSGTMAQSSTSNMFPALGNMFNQLGVNSRAYHNYKGSYYSRNESWPNMGFQCTFADTGLNITSGWPGSDLEMFQQSVDDYINDNQFCVYYMTFSGHGEYSEKNAIAKKNLDYTRKTLGSDADPLTSEDVAYLACHYELDQALGYLMDRLQETGKDKNTVVVLAGDHYPYYLFTQSRNAFAGHNVDKHFEMYQSTCIMWNGGMGQPVQVDTPCCNVDILPTILNLFNVPYDSRLYAGVDIFSDATHVAQLYNKNFITDRVKYKAEDGKTTWLDENDPATEDEKSAYVESMKNIVNKRYSVSLAMSETNFYDFVASNAVIPTVDAAAAAEKAAAVNAAAGTMTAAPVTDPGQSNEVTQGDDMTQDTNVAQGDTAVPGEDPAEGNGMNQDNAMDQGETIAQDDDSAQGEAIAQDEDAEDDIEDYSNMAESEDTPDMTESEGNSEKKKGGFFSKLLKFIFYVILILVVMFLYINRRYFRKRIRRYLKRRRRRNQRNRRRY